MLIINDKSIAGSTIIEVVTGVFLISLGMALSIVVFTKTMDNANLYVKHQAINAVNELVMKQTKEMNFTSEETDLDDIQIISSTTPFPGNDSLQIVNYSASLISTGKQLYTRKLIKNVHNN
jgi:hypothetical protein